jgi:hypothetical protein
VPAPHRRRRVRADVMFDERGYEDMAELLVLLEEREWARQALIEELMAL